MMPSVASFKVIVIAGIAAGTVGGGALALILGADSRRSEPTTVTAHAVPPQPAPIAQPTPLPVPTAPPVPNAPDPVVPGPARKAVSKPARRPGPSPQGQTGATSSAPPVSASTVGTEVASVHDATALTDSGLQALYAGRYPEAVNIFGRVYAIEPTSVALFNLATAHAASLDFRMALTEVKQLLEPTKGTRLGDASQRLARRIRTQCAERKIVCE